MPGLVASDAISLAIKVAEGVTTPSGNGFTVRRAQALHHFNTRLGQVFRWKDQLWPWNKNVETVTVPAVGGEFDVGYARLPQWFAGFGEDGYAARIDASDRRRLLTVEPAMRPKILQLHHNVAAGIPTHCAVVYNDYGTPATSDSLLLVVGPKPLESTSVEVFGLRYRPQIFDSATPSYSTEGLSQFHRAFSEDILVNFVIGDLYADKGDQQMAGVYHKKAEDALAAQARSFSIQRMRTQRLPRFFAGRHRR
jgi:hypothetical protein